MIRHNFLLFQNYKMSRSSSSAWILSKDGAKTAAIYVQKPSVFLENFGPQSTIFKPLVALFKANHGITMYNVSVWDVNAQIARQLHFVVGTENVEGNISTYGPQAVVEEEENYRDAMDAVMEVFREEVAKKHLSEANLSIDKVPCLRGSVIYADWPYKKDVISGVQDLKAASPLGTVILRSINYNGQAGKNTVYAKLQMSSFGFGAPKRPVKRKSEETETPAVAEDAKQAAVE